MAVASLVGTPAANAAQPGSRFDLSHWKLTLPTGADNQYSGHATEVSASQLTAGFQDPHFQTDANGHLVFWCPVNGATTEGTEFPRFELREMLKRDDPSANWTSKGTHALAARCRVLQVPSNPKVVIGQVHSYSGQAEAYPQDNQRPATEGARCLFQFACESRRKR